LPLRCASTYECPMGALVARMGAFTICGAWIGDTLPCSYITSYIYEHLLKQ
jgi:hypothetical protein